MSRPRIRRKRKIGVEMFDLSGVTREDVKDCLWVAYGRCRYCKRTLGISRNALGDQKAIDAAADYHNLQHAEGRP